MGLSSIRIAFRLPAAFFLIVALSLAVLVVFSYSSAKRTLIASGEQEIQQIARTRADELEIWAAEVQTDLSLQANNPLVYNALRSFHAAWQTLGPSAREDLQALYATGQGAELIDAGDGSVYSRIHSRFHEHFQSVAQRGGYADILLLNPAGTVIYSINKGRSSGSTETAFPPTRCSPGLSTCWPNMRVARRPLSTSRRMTCPAKPRHSSWRLWRTAKTWRSGRSSCASTPQRSPPVSALPAAWAKAAWPSSSGATERPARLRRTGPTRRWIRWAI